MTKTKQNIRNDWISKTLAGLILGFLAGLGISGLFLFLSPDINESARAQLAMWLLSPIWLSLLGTVYLFRSGLSAWVWLSLLNLLIYMLFFLFKLLS